MGPGQAQPGGPLRRLMGFHVFPQLLRQHRGLRRRVRDGGHRLIPNLQFFLSAGALPVVEGGVLVQPDGELMPVVDEHRAEAHQPLIEIRQRRQQVRPLFRVPEDAGLVLVGPVVLGQRRGISGAQLT